ncbi:MAG: hypothetical protein IPP66_07210 [Anaerolineales bacterium]|nr:hypothetical protein [Anaerolineales bacterium]
MKIKLNPMFEEARGQLGGMVLRELRGETIASRKPSSIGEPTVDQAAQRERFKLAAAYGKSALADPLTRALYEAAANNKKIPVFALTVADYLNPPTIHEVDLSGFSGEIGQAIRIKASDDFGVARVSVTISDNAGSLVYEGDDAIETAPGSGVWVYTTTGGVPDGVTAKVSVVAADRPGGVAVQDATKVI